jgi:hypothetical protein
MGNSNLNEFFDFDIWKVGENRPLPIVLVPNNLYNIFFFSIFIYFLLFRENAIFKFTISYFKILQENHMKFQINSIITGCIEKNRILAIFSSFLDPKFCSTILKMKIQKLGHRKNSSKSIPVFYTPCRIFK